MSELDSRTPSGTAVALPAGSGKAPPPPAGVRSVDDCVELSGA